MMKTYAISIYPGTSLASMITSDTMFGAICWGMHILQLKPSIEELLAADAAPFICSGLFPMRTVEQQKIRFYPRPLTLDVNPGIVEGILKKYQASDQKYISMKLVALLKQFKKAAYVSEGIMRQLVTQAFPLQSTLESWLAEEEKADIRQMGNLLIGRQELEQGWSRKDRTYGKIEIPTTTQHTQIDRLTGAAAEGLLFFEGETFYPPGSGLWLVARAEEERLKVHIEPALRYLEDTGLGANRTSGKGHFRFEIEEWNDLPDGEGKANAFMALSRYLPLRDELASNLPMAYQISNLWAKREKKFPQRYAGTNESAPIYKKRMRVFEPGSVFSCSARQEYFGRTALVVGADEPDGPVYQSGLCIPLFLCAGKGEKSND